MFWKNTVNRVRLFFDSTDRREAFRITPEPVIQVSLDHRLYDIADISIGGVSFHARGLSSGEQYDARIDPHGISFEGRIEILGMRDDNLCHARFIELPDKRVDQLHRFIIDQQKRQIRNQPKTD